MLLCLPLKNVSVTKNPEKNEYDFFRSQYLCACVDAIEVTKV